MTIALPTKWIWDSWYVRDGDLWHGFFLQADKALKDPDLRHFNVTQGHATSHDLKSWEHKGTTFAPAEGPAWDDYTTWTGSVVQDDDGMWHLFYTGTNRPEEGLKQRIGHATSTDLQHWSRVGDGLALDLSGDIYERYTPGHWHDQAMRDPWVMPDPQGGWMMFFTGRKAGVAEPNAGGVIGFATSPNLYDWTLQPPAYAGGAFGQMEVPQVFEANGHWYCLHRRDALLEGLCRHLSGHAGAGHALPPGRRSARAVGGGAGGIPRRRSGGQPVRGTDSRDRRRAAAPRLPAQPRRRRLRRRDRRPGAGDDRRRRLAEARLT